MSQPKTFCGKTIAIKKPELGEGGKPELILEHKDLTAGIKEVVVVLVDTSSEKPVVEKEIQYHLGQFQVRDMKSGNTSGYADSSRFMKEEMAKVVAEKLSKPELADTIRAEMTVATLLRATNSVDFRFMLEEPRNSPGGEKLRPDLDGECLDE